ncbi:hypothetical protein TNIN_287311 [Trichonephila inaurata madagascariensis]|uniref:Uncharacterized protein n=1 Tax=Trichonephila inaurata madagascariensis TaxID=2747483 RepID=A0A8X6WTP6_9ARAC|nr:hypothetical protein TNIN_287311 [Trichonephila inaurata madagascariensis]
MLRKEACTGIQKASFTTDQIGDFRKKNEGSSQRMFEKHTICNEIEGHDIVASHYKDLDKTPDTAENHEMKEILRAALKDTLQKKADLVSELRSLPMYHF